jgi:3-deoxy-manno-octulosonate cytidylyltransferase (CMP-KDO synthetase)
MSTLIVIPARLGATRLPNKPLRLLGGKPLILRVWERVMAMKAADRVVIATDHADVAAAARAGGAEVAMTRADHISGTDRIAEVANQSAYAAYHVIVNVQGDEPYLNADAVTGAARFVEQGIYPLGTAAAPGTPEILGTPDIVKVVTDDARRALYFSRAPIPFLRDSADATHRDALIQQHLGVYAYGRDALNRWVSLPPHPLELVERLEQLRAIADGMAMGVAVVAAVPHGGIDTEQDLIAANALWSDRDTPAPTPAGTR